MNHRLPTTLSNQADIANPLKPTSSYRFDLDGLRGIAIALVVIFHVFVGRVSGGVDVFLLLSGYFFLGSQLRYAGKNDASLNPWWPIWRTFRRLAPALFLTLGVTALLVTFVARNLGSGELYRQFTAAVLYYQNWELAAQDADYTAASATTSPLQHMWSMSVQGQFYIVGILFALGLAYLWRKERAKRIAMDARRKHSRLDLDGQAYVFRVAGPILIVITLASFAYAARFGFFGTPANYYSTFSRAWELTLGAVLAIYGSRIRFDARTATIATALGLICILITGFVITNTQAFPGPLTLLPLSGAALVILGGSTPGNPISAALSGGVFRWLGDIAYSLYLWHWPLLIVATAYLQQQRPSFLLGLGIIIVSLGLAHLTHRYVEKPLAQHRKRPVAQEKPAISALTDLRHNHKPKARALGGVAVIALAAMLLSLQPRYEARVADAELRAKNFNPADYPGALALTGAEVPDLPYAPDPTLVGRMFPATTTDGCTVGNEGPGDFFTETKKNGEPCVYGDTDSDITVVITGGSHAEQWFTPLNQLAKDYHFKLIPLLRQDCAIMISEEAVDPRCAQWSQLATDRIIAMQPDLVITTSTRPGINGGYATDIVPQSYVRFWDQLAAAGIRTLALRDNPWATEDGRASDLSMCLALTDDIERCSLPRTQIYTDPNPTDAFAAAYPLITFVDTSGWFCPTGTCPPVIGNVVVYRNQDHISEPYATSLKPLLWDNLNPLISAQLNTANQQRFLNNLSGTPTGTEVPAAPVTLVQPVTPVAPVEPVSPAAPASPVAPAPSSPAAPAPVIESPVAPVAPVSPVAPVDPAAPEVPTAPTAPSAPVAPDTNFQLPPY